MGAANVEIKNKKPSSKKLAKMCHKQPQETKKMGRSGEIRFHHMTEASLLSIFLASLNLTQKQLGMYSQIGRHLKKRFIKQKFEWRRPKGKSKKKKINENGARK
jgi:hypothetical protein